MRLITGALILLMANPAAGSKIVAATNLLKNTSLPDHPDLAHALTQCVIGSLDQSFTLQT